jgi:predicted transposase YdaD
MAEHDSGYKLLFSHPRMVEELLRGFVREPWVEDLDFRTLERVGESYTTDDLRERYSDVVWRLQWCGEGKGWFYVYLLLEFQSTPDPFMAIRLLGYVALLLAGLVRKGQATPATGLPTVLPLVVYNGKRAWKAPADLTSLFRDVPPGCERYLPRLTYLLVDENRLRPEEVALPGNRVATLFRLETCAPKDLAAFTAQLVALIPKGQEPELRGAVAAWVRHLFRRQLPGVTIPEVLDLEDPAMLEETLNEWFNGARKEGRREGRQAGQVQGMRQLLLHQLEQRFGALPPKVRKRVQAITSLSRLEELARRVLVVGSLAEMGLG